MRPGETHSPRILETPLADLHRAAGAGMGVWLGCALPDDFGDWRKEYSFASEAVALIDKNYRAYLSFTGPDRVRYLNAILTNNIKDLQPGRGVVSLFLNPQGRIQAEIETYAETEKLFCVSYAMIREQLVPALDKYIIMDDVTLSDDTHRYGTLALEGPRSADAVRELTGLDLAGFAELEFRESAIASLPCRLFRRSPGNLPGAEFLASRESLPALWKVLCDAVSKHGGGPMGYSALSSRRLELGVPWFGYDFDDKQIPHEAGLENSHVSFTKGCYTGQEIVERVRSRGQVNRVRVLLQFDGEILPAPDAALLANEKEVGSFTRVAFSPALNAGIGMGYVRREHSALGTTLAYPGGQATVISPPLA